MPFEGTEKQIRNKVIYKMPKFNDKSWQESSYEARQLVLNLLQKDKRWRLDVKDILHH